MSQKHPILVAGSLLAATSGLFWTIGSAHHSQKVPAYQVVEVYDGDTFKTDTGLKVRLAGIDAPEIDLCDGAEAKKTLESLILGKNLYLKVISFDPYNRLVAYAYTEDKFINQQMLAAGMAFIARTPANAPPELKAGSDAARSQKKGIYSSRCTQSVNPTNPSCNIKGNNLVAESTKVYHFPGCGQYTQTQVQLYQGDQWFCSEAEAKKAGYVRGKDCFDLQYPAIQN